MMTNLSLTGPGNQPSLGWQRPNEFSSVKGAVFRSESGEHPNHTQRSRQNTGNAPVLCDEYATPENLRPRLFNTRALFDHPTHGTRMHTTHTHHNSETDNVTTVSFQRHPATHIGAITDPTLQQLPQNDRQTPRKSLYTAPSAAMHTHGVNCYISKILFNIIDPMACVLVTHL